MGLGDFLLSMLEQGARDMSRTASKYSHDERFSSRAQDLSDRAESYANSADRIHDFRESLRQRH